MAIVPQPLTPSSSHVPLIRSLHSAITSLPRSSLQPSLINYVLFPITQILQQTSPSQLPDSLLEAIFQLLAYVVDAWQGCEGGMDKTALEQLWRFTIASVAMVKGKGKGRQVSQEVKLQATALLDALLSRPTNAMLDTVKDAKSPLMPTLFQSITFLLDTAAPEPRHPQLQRASLKLLKAILPMYLRGKLNILAAILPGTISTLSKMLHAAGVNVKGETVELALGLMQEAIVLTLSDEGLRREGLLRPKIDDLSQLSDWDPPGDSKPSSSNEPFPQITRSYLEFTSAQLLKALVPIMSSLSIHTNPTARQAVADLAYRLLSRCAESLPDLVPHCLSALLLLSQDEFDPVREYVRGRLRQLDISFSLVDLLSDVMSSIPRMILSGQSEKVERLTKMGTAVAELTANDTSPLAILLGPHGRVERWIGPLLSCLEFGRPSTWRMENDSAKRLAEKGWEEQIFSRVEQGDFPTLPLRHVESERTVRTIREMLIAMGSAAGDSGLHTVEYLVGVSQSSRPARSAPALWVAQFILDGIARGQVGSAEGRVSKATRKMAREVARAMVEMDEEKIEEWPEDNQSPTDELVLVERSKGIGEVSLLPHKVHQSQSKDTLHEQGQRSVLTALSLSTLALSSRILSSSFRPLLLNALYHLLSHLASPQSLVQNYAGIALSQVAYSCGYSSERAMVIDNVDYVINVVSQRLTHTNLSSTAPLVLIAMIRLVGAEIVPIVHDVVDEIFDALDDFHGYEVLASGLLAVLVALIDVMAKEIEADGPSGARRAKLAELRRVDLPPEPERDFEQFVKWYGERSEERKEDINRMLERAPQRAWGTDRDGNEEDAQAEPNGDAEDDKDIPPTRAEAVCAEIVDKSLNFLSHRSPFLRARVLSLTSRATPVLAMGNREGDLLPLIDKHWKVILNRLDDLPYIVSEATELIAALCEHCGDFMGRRILDQVWPRCKRLLETQQAKDHRSALAKRGVIDTEWSVSHRLHIGILRTARWIVEQVPVNDRVLWEMMVLFRPMIDARAHEELQKVAMEVYGLLGKRDGDALWVVLTATRSNEGIWGYLCEPGLDISSSVEILLEGL